jgi:hypothetical protein
MAPVAKPGSDLAALEARLDRLEALLLQPGCLQTRHNRFRRCKRA